VTTQFGRTLSSWVSSASHYNNGGAVDFVSLISQMYPLGREVASGGEDPGWSSAAGRGCTQTPGSEGPGEK
jgi:hypothetical protein